MIHKPNFNFLLGSSIVVAALAFGIVAAACGSATPTPMPPPTATTTASAPTATATEGKASSDPVSNRGYNVRGEDDAPITLFDFSDFL